MVRFAKFAKIAIINKRRDVGAQFTKMVDNRTSGYFGIGGAFNFKSGDISGTAAKTADDRQSPGMEYFQQQQKHQPQGEQQSAVDRSAQLNATLSSLAMNNIATILQKQKRKKDFDESIQNLSNIDKPLISEIESKEEEQKKNKKESDK